MRMQFLLALFAAQAFAIEGAAPPKPVPYFFEKNIGQASPEVQFLARRAGMTLLVTQEETVLRAQHGYLGFRFIGADPASKWDPIEPRPALEIRSMVGGQERWRDKIPAFAKLQRRGLYPGIDAVAYGKPGGSQQFEYDLIVSPGTNPNGIAFALRTAGGARIAMENGDIVVRGTGKDAPEFRHRKPTVYQWIDGAKAKVKASYKRLGPARFGYAIGRYDRSKPLVIDPVVVSQLVYIGGSADDTLTFVGRNIACGYTISVDMRGTLTTTRTDIDAFLMFAQFGDSGAVTYVGGSGDDRGIACSYAGGLTLVGETNSPDLPVGAFDYQSRPIAPLNIRPQLQKIYGGGSSDGFLYDSRQRQDPVLIGYWGGAGTDRITSVYDDYGQLSIAGETDSVDFLGKSMGGIDGFAANLSLELATIAAQRFGGSGTDRVKGFGLGSSFPLSLAVIGSSDSSDFGAVAGGYDAYVRLLDYYTLDPISTVWYGGSGDDLLSGAIAVTEQTWLYGATTSKDLPLQRPMQSAFGGGQTDGFLRCSIHGRAESIGHLIGVVPARMKSCPQAAAVMVPTVLCSAAAQPRRTCLKKTKFSAGLAAEHPTALSRPSRRTARWRFPAILEALAMIECSPPPTARTDRSTFEV